MHELTMFDRPPESNSALICLITSDQKAMVVNELHRLFVFHGKRLSDDERGMFAADLCSGSLPYKAILAGIRELQKVKLKSVTFWELQEACQKHAAEEYRPVPCDNCVNGRVTMARATEPFFGNRTVFACICTNGKRWVNTMPRLPQWNGLEEQTMMERSHDRQNEPITFRLVKA